MLTLLFIFLMLGVFGKLVGLAFRATWGVTKICFRLIFLPVVLIGLALAGLMYIAPAAACDHRNCSAGAGLMCE